MMRIVQLSLLTLPLMLGACKNSSKPQGASTTQRAGASSGGDTKTTTDPYTDAAIKSQANARTLLDQLQTNGGVTEEQKDSPVIKGALKEATTPIPTLATAMQATASNPDNAQTVVAASKSANTGAAVGLGIGAALSGAVMLALFANAIDNVVKATDAARVEGAQEMAAKWAEAAGKEVAAAGKEVAAADGEAKNLRGELAKLEEQAKALPTDPDRGELERLNQAKTEAEARLAEARGILESLDTSLQTKRADLEKLRSLLTLIPERLPAGITMETLNSDTYEWLGEKLSKDAAIRKIENDMNLLPSNSRDQAQLVVNQLKTEIELRNVEGFGEKIRGFLSRDNLNSEDISTLRKELQALEEKHKSDLGQFETNFEALTTMQKKAQVQAELLIISRDKAQQALDEAQAKQTASESELAAKKQAVEKAQAALTEAKTKLDAANARLAAADKAKGGIKPTEKNMLRKGLEYTKIPLGGAWWDGQPPGRKAAVQGVLGGVFGVGMIVMASEASKASGAGLVDDTTPQDVDPKSPLVQYGKRSMEIWIPLFQCELNKQAGKPCNAPAQ